MNKFVAPAARAFGSLRTVRCEVYGQKLQMPAEHPLPEILIIHPQYNRPLALTAKAVASTQPRDSSVLAVVDVGANIGDTVAILEQALPGQASFLCIEPEDEIAALCEANHQANPRVTVVRAFVGEQEDAVVFLEDDGRANPSTRAASEGAATGRLQRLDSLARAFADAHGRLDLIKVDTEGFDFAVLRSGVELLQHYRPTLFFEWFPGVLQEDPIAGFHFLHGLGYEHWVFFTNRGDFCCVISGLHEELLTSLLRVTQHNEAIPYFDVVATTDRSVRDALSGMC